MPSPTLTIPDLEAEERDLALDRFDQDDAWWLGRHVADAALAAGHGVAIDIRRPGLILFRASLPGSTPDQEHWVRRKSAVVLRLESSTALIRLRHEAAGIDPTTGWLPTADYAVAGGSVPIRVTGVGVVAAITISGLTSDDDHRLAVEGLRALQLRGTEV